VNGIVKIMYNAFYKIMFSFIGFTINFRIDKSFQLLVFKDELRRNCLAKNCIDFFVVNDYNSIYNQL
jgi:hypothetical protein